MDWGGGTPRPVLLTGAKKSGVPDYLRATVWAFRISLSVIKFTIKKTKLYAQHEHVPNPLTPSSRINIASCVHVQGNVHEIKIKPLNINIKYKFNAKEMVHFSS